MPTSSLLIQPEWTPVGYAALVRRYGLKVLPHFCQSFVAQRGQQKEFGEPGRITHVYRKEYAIGDTLGEHLEFALKYEGVNLEILSALFEKIDPAELVAFIKTKPSGKQARRIWFLYEFLTGQMLELEDLKRFTRYDNLLDEAEYFTADRRPSPRHKISDNLLGGRLFCPMIRRTPRLMEFIDTHLDQRCQEVLQHYPEEVLRRALDYLFTKETKSSFEIEHITPDSGRTARFVSLLKKAGTDRFLSKEAMLGLQQATVDERFANKDYRAEQNYVGITLGYGQEQVHYISPRPEEVPSLMEGLFESARRMLEAQVQPVLIAGAVAFGFVFIHPFGDGNGRLHRFLIHHVLAKTGFTPSGFIFPVSATMLRQRAKYDALLESYSQPLLALVDYSINLEGEMTVHGDTAHHYRTIDMTHIVEGLFEFMQETVETELPSEMQFLVSYDKARQALQEIVDMPDRLIDLFIKVCLQNNGRLSKAKRESQFAKLTDDEIIRMESSVHQEFRV